MAYKTITYQVADRVGVITLNRPKVYNAISEECIREITAALDEAARSPVVRVVVFTGADRFFSAGADISELNKSSGVSGALGFSRKYQRLCTTVENFEKPTVAAISGFALGGGCELALACDMRVLAANGELGLPEIDIGAFPAGGGTQKLPRLIGAARAKDILYTGRRLGAAECLSLGLANRVAENGGALASALQLAGVLAEKSPTALRQMKKAINVGQNLDFASGLALETECFGVLSSHPNFTEGVKAFLEKRKPKFEDD